MTNLTIAIDEELLKSARIRALEQGTSVNELLRQYIEAYAAKDRHIGLERFLTMARLAKTGSGVEGRQWKREDIYE